MTGWELDITFNTLTIVTFKYYHKMIISLYYTPGRNLVWMVLYVQFLIFI